MIQLDLFLHVEVASDPVVVLEGLPLTCQMTVEAQIILTSNLPMATAANIKADNPSE